jgi:Na+-driven multidrug efflux pump
VWLVRIPLSYVLAFVVGLGLVGIWITMIVDWLARAVAFYALYRRGKWATLSL